MRFWRYLLAPLLLSLACAGCTGTRGKSGEPQTTAPARPEPSRPIVTPSNVLSGRVLKSKPGMGFAVLVFPVGQMPALEQRMTVYRGGLKVGEVRVTGPQRDDKIVADVVAGEAAEGDEVRSP